MGVGGIENNPSWGKNFGSPVTAGGYKINTWSQECQSLSPMMAPEQMSTGQMVLSTEENSHKWQLLLEVIKTSSLSH